MKRNTAVLTLIVAGFLLSAIPLLPGEVLAVDLGDESLEVPDTRDDLEVDLQGKVDEDQGGDSDSWQDGLGYVDDDDVLDLSGVIPDDPVLRDLWAYLMSMIWLVP